VSTASTTDPYLEPEPLPRTVRVAPWHDPVVDRRGHDPRSAYVEQFWLGVLGPTATWLLRRLVAGFDHQPDGYELDVAASARSLGLSVAKGTVHKPALDYRHAEPSPTGVDLLPHLEGRHDHHPAGH